MTSGSQLATGNTPDTSLHHVLLGSIQRGFEIDPAAGIVDHEYLEPGRASVDSAPGHTEIRGKPGQKQPPQAALAQVSGQAGRRSPVCLEEGGIAVDAAVISLSDDKLRAGQFQAWRECGARRALDAMGRPQHLRPIGERESLERGPPGVTGRERDMIGWMPVLGEQDMAENLSKAIDRCNHLLPAGDGQGSTRQKILLHVHDQKNIIRHQVHRSLPAHRYTGSGLYPGPVARPRLRPVPCRKNEDIPGGRPRARVDKVKSGMIERPFGITVCGIDELAGHCGIGASHVLSILDPGFPMPDAFGTFSEHKKLELRFDDIIEEMPDRMAPQPEHVGHILAFGRDLATEARPGAHLLVHCHAGISRSTAAMTLLLAQALPHQPADAILAHIHEIREKAWPNLRLIEIGDALLGRRGTLVAAAHALYRVQLERRPHLAVFMEEAGRGREVAAAGVPSSSG